MTKPKAPQEILDRRREGRKHEQPATANSVSTKAFVLNLLQRSKHLPGILLASLGFVTGYLSLVPRLSVSQNQPLDLNNPFSTPFVLSNDGPLGMNNLQFSCFVFKVENAEGFTIADNLQTTMFLGSKRMEPGERATIPCDTAPMTLQGPFGSADVAVHVSFRPDFVFWQKAREFRFVTQHGSDGHLYWYPQPLDGPVSSPVEGYPPK